MVQQVIISSSVKIPLSMMIFTTLFLFLMMGIMVFISLARNCQSLFFIALMLITISSSSAPSTIANTSSATFASTAAYPNGNPITVATFTPLPLVSATAFFTNKGGTQTAAN